MKKLTLISVLVIICLSNSCTKELPPADGSPAGDDLYSPAPPALYPGFTVSNEFGLKLYETLYRAAPDSNLCISPFSIRTCLSLVANGAAGEDLQEILKALNVKDNDLVALNEDYKNLATYLTGADPDVTFESANSLWYQDGINVFQPFRSDLNDYYQAEVFPVDFKASGTIKLINDWVSNKTHEKITEIVRVIPPNTVMNLTNAIYFNGEWTHKFNRNLTKPYTFKKLDQTRVNIAVMQQTRDFRYYEHPSWFGLEMTYGGNERWAMYTFMPKKIGSLKKLTEWLVVNWKDVRTQFESDQPIMVYYPIFKMENTFHLIPTLANQGINRIFSMGANFSRMTDEKVFIGEVIHKTYIRVNEDGTEAAAVTSAWPMTGGPSGLFFDHPFTYIIAERSTGLILFIGQVMDPK